MRLAGMMSDPYVLCDTRNGSLQARFFLTDRSTMIRSKETSPEISRKGFNIMRNTGRLDDRQGKQVKIDSYRAWKVVFDPKEDEQNGHQEQARDAA